VHNNKTALNQGHRPPPSQYSKWRKDEAACLIYSFTVERRYTNTENRLASSFHHHRAFWYMGAYVHSVGFDKVAYLSLIVLPRPLCRSSLCDSGPIRVISVARKLMSVRHRLIQKRPTECVCDGELVISDSTTRYFYSQTMRLG
jgi:hypothetical protein